MNGYRFHLQKYRPGSKIACPACGRKSCFTRYIDEAGEISFPDSVGMCDHINSCGYRYAPKEYFRDNLSEQEKLNMLLKEKMEKLAEREATINKLQAEVDAQNARLQSLLNSVKDALLGFSSDELTVTEKNGKIYVAMSDKLLFESGSAQVNKQGKEALGKLAEVLKKQHDIDVFIEGHTDNKPIKTVQFKDNWDLSVVRATSVVRILTKDYGVNPLQILPCGRGEFMPVDNNESVEGRAHNRRTEIIMAPKLDKLMDILK